jgi:hypothetical protein
MPMNSAGKTLMKRVFEITSAAEGKTTIVLSLRWKWRAFHSFVILKAS